MSYYICYDKSVEVRISENRKHRRWVLTCLWFLFFSLLVKAFWDKGNAVLYHLLWKDAEVLAESVQYVFSEVRKGQGFAEAVQGFCREIIQDAKIAG